MFICSIKNPKNANIIKKSLSNLYYIIGANVSLKLMLNIRKYYFFTSLALYFLTNLSK